MLIGFVVYFTYGYRNSRVGRGEQPVSDPQASP
jgi:hypothetical protein